METPFVGKDRGELAAHLERKSFARPGGPRFDLEPQLELVPPSRGRGRRGGSSGAPSAVGGKSPSAGTSASGVRFIGGSDADRVTSEDEEAAASAARGVPRGAGRLGLYPLGKRARRSFGTAGRIASRANAKTRPGETSG